MDAISRFNHKLNLQDLLLATIPKYSRKYISLKDEFEMSNNSKLLQAIQKATNPGLRGDNWGFIIDVCDLVKVDPEESGEYTMKKIEEELQGRDANVILRSLSLLVALAENCGSRLQQAISSKHFTGVLLKLVEDRKVHVDVKRQVLKIVTQLSDSFKDDPSLKYMHDLQLKIESKHPSLTAQPFVPKKTELNMGSKASEDHELQEAMKLSLLEYEKKTYDVRSQQDKQRKEEPLETSQQQQKEQEEQQRNEQAVTIIRKVRAMYDLTASESDELSFRKGDVITVVEQVYRDWWKGTLRGKVGIFPLNYVTPISDPTKQEREAEKLKEEEILSQKGNVVRLHQKLRENPSTAMIQDQEINELYGKVTPLRPDISKMLAKYAQKKEDLVSLRQIMVNAEATYNQLLSRAANVYTSPVASPMAPPIRASPSGGMAQNYPTNPHPFNSFPNTVSRYNQNVGSYSTNPPAGGSSGPSPPLQQQQPQQQFQSVRQNGSNYQPQDYRFAQSSSSPYPMSTQNTGL